MSKRFLALINPNTLTWSVVDTGTDPKSYLAIEVQSGLDEYDARICASLRNDAFEMDLFNDQGSEFDK